MIAAEDEGCKFMNVDDDVYGSKFSMKRTKFEMEDERNISLRVIVI